MRLITLEQEEEVVRLYRSEKYTIKQICKMTGVLSEQTIYRILRERNIPKREIRIITKKISVSLDHETELILDKIKRAFEVNQTVVVSFESVPYVSTSFVNSAFINLLSDYSFERIREDLKIINSNSQINSLIKNRFAFETSKIAVV